MPWPDPVTLEGEHATLVPLNRSHFDDLAEATTDGELWKLWYTFVPTATGSLYTAVPLIPGVAMVKNELSTVSKTPTFGW